jgi:hypothetical protein
MKGLKIFMGLLAVFVTAPIWYFLMYTILSAIHPDRLIWFLFWVYVPVGLMLSVLQVVLGANDKK